MASPRNPTESETAVYYMEDVDLAQARKNEIDIKALKQERGRLHGFLANQSALLAAESSHVKELEGQVKDFKLQLSEGTHARPYKQQIAQLSAQLESANAEATEAKQRAYDDGVEHGVASQIAFHPGDESTILIQQVQLYKGLADHWKIQAQRGAGEAIHSAYQEAVDEAVRREREKDALVLKMLQDEIKALKAEK